MVLDCNPEHNVLRCVFFKVRFPSRIQLAQVCQINILDSNSGYGNVYMLQFE